MEVAHLAEQLLQLKTGREIAQFRARLDPETARAVIHHESIPPERRGAISLALNFAGDHWRGETSRIVL